MNSSGWKYSGSSYFAKNVRIVRFVIKAENEATKKSEYLKKIFPMKKLK
jgi:hypothetical protein